MAQVKKGDTISAIAAKAKVSVAAIAAANPQIKNLGKISVGQTINIPKVDTKVKTSSNIYAGGLTGGSNPFSAGSNASQATKDKLLGVAGVIPTKVTGGTDGGTPPPPPPETDEFPAAGTVLGSSSVDNGDGTFTITTIYADGKGGTYQQVTQSGKKKEEEDKTKTTNLSEEAFINTLKLIMGSAEASKPYVKQLYTLVSKYYKSGSTIPDAINLALYDAEENKLIPEFTTRFSGIFKLRDRRAAGEIIDVPTIAEYIKSQEGIAEVLRNTGLKDLANETFLNQVMGTGKSVAETTRVITDVYDAIRLAPKEWRSMVQTKMPFATDTDLAKALLLGAEGAADLERKVNKYGIMAAAQGQGLTVDEAAAGEFLAKGQGYASSKPKFGQAAGIIPVAQKLTSMETGVKPVKAYTQEQAFSAVFDQNYQALQNIQNLSEREQGRFAAKSGRFASRDRAAGQI
jgi:murein DD-endopeptidase MepM/ murein hydrolase activator NlpD